jgi:PAS domain S-box-containing protein
MFVPPMPKDELQRLIALRSLHILDTPPEERFDRITRLAISFFRVPIALITLIEEKRQWFKSHYGTEIVETPREVAFCAHAILDHDPLVIPDTLLDPRFVNHPLVVHAPHIRFYAGCPIRDIDGYTLGTLCIIDRVPRQLNEEGRQALRDMATWAEHEINTTRIKQAFMAQRESKARLGAIMESTSEAMALVSPDRRFLAVNQRFGEFFHIAAEQLVEQTLDRFSSTFKRIFTKPELIQHLTVDMLADTQQQFTAFVQQQWPIARELELFSTAVYSENVHLGRLFVFRDVTRERELAAMKDKLLADVSHELRTPLTAIKGYIDILAESEVGPLTTTQANLLQIVQTNTNRLIALTNDLLDLSRIEAGQLELHRTPIQIQPILQNVVDLLQSQLTAKEQTLTLHLQEQLPSIPADARRLTQVFTNILSNAHYYTPAGGTITITTQSDEHYLSIHIQDNGIGLSRDEQAHIFNDFYRGQSGSAEFSEGTGLGLAISRSIVEAHHGKIAVASTPGQGSTFSILLPTVAELRRNLS